MVVLNIRQRCVSGSMTQSSNHGFITPPKLYRIGDIVRSTPFTRQTIHNYTVMGLIQESDWTEGGHRLYDESVFERLWRIQQLRETKTLSEIRDMFQSEQAIKAS